MASIERLDRLGQLPQAALTPTELVNGRGLLAVGTWEGSKTQLSPSALFGGRFALVSATHSATSVQADGCTDFAPETVSPPMEVRLRPVPGGHSASVRVVSAPASPGLTNHVAALLVPRTGPGSTTAVQLTVPPDGTGYLSDNDSRSELVLLWDIGTPLELCGLAPGPGG